MFADDYNLGGKIGDDLKQFSGFYLKKYFAW